MAEGGISYDPDDHYHEDEQFHQPQVHWRQTRSQHFNYRVICIVSLTLNTILILYISLGWLSPQSQPQPDKSMVSAFAGLARDVPRQWTPLHASENVTEENYTWDVLTTYDRGQVALSDEYAKSMGLPRAQRFPWDRSKGIYLLNAYHNLHCVKALRNSLLEHRNGSSQSSPWGHIQHCLHVLRDEVMCNADDVPRYTGFQPYKKSGLGQWRMCRDWTKLEAWADQHTACWKHVGNDSDPSFKELDRYRFCPDDSLYKEMSETEWLNT